MNIYEEKIQKAAGIVEPLLGEEGAKDVKTRAAEATAALNGIQKAKVAVTGDFNAGKTAVTNAILGDDGKLPEDAKPETAIPCEAVPTTEGEQPYIEVFRDGAQHWTGDIADYAGQNVLPGDYAVVHTSSSTIKGWYDRDLVWVDMPGANSGIKAHNDALIRYIKEGNIFVFLVDSQAGAVSKTDLSLINELQQYGYDVAVFLSRTDLVMAENLPNIAEYVKQQLAGLPKPVKLAGKLCAHPHGGGQADVQDLLSWMESVEATPALNEKRSTVVRKFIDTLITAIEGAYSALAKQQEGVNVEEEIAKLEDAINNLSKELDDKLKEIDTVEKSTNDILGAIKTAVDDNAERLAVVLLESRGNSEVFTQALLEIVRPTLVKAFEQEQNEIMTTLKIKLEAINSELLGSLQTLLEEDSFGITDILLLITEQLKEAGGIAALIAQVIGLIGGFIKSIFGHEDNAADKKAQIADKIRTDINNRIVQNMRQDVMLQVRQMQYRAVEAVKKDYTDRIAMLRSALEAIEQSQHNAEQYQQALTDLKELR